MYNILLSANLNIVKDIIIVLWWTFMCIFTGREAGSAIDKENRNPSGKPIFVIIPNKWKWLFRNRVNTYAGRTKILKISFVLQVLGYLFAFFEIVLFIIILFEGKQRLVVFSIRFYVLYILLSMGLGCVSSYRYERNMQISYDYDWITYFQEAFTLYSKRSCRITNKRDERTYEIAIGLFHKHKYLATAKHQVNVGEKKYAIHVYDEGGPYWIIKDY